MRKVSLILLQIILVVTSCFAQLGNEWINNADPYVKVQVADNGFYRVDYSELVDLGVVVSSIDPRSFRLLRRGKDWAVSVSGEQDGSFDSGDYLEFFALKNDSKDEKELFLDTLFQFQDEYSFYTDTASYFLTWGGVSGERILTDISTSETISNNVIATVDTVYSDAYSVGNEPRSFIFNSEIDEGEGWMNGSVRSGDVKKETFILNAIPLTGEGELLVTLVGVNNNQHSAQLLVESNTGNSKLINVAGFKEHETKVVSIDLSSGFLGTEFSVSLIPLGVDGKIDFISFSKIELEFVSESDFSGFVNSQVEFKQSPKVSTLFISPPGSHKLYSYFNEESFQFVNDVSSSLLLSNNSSDEKYYYLRKNNEFKNATLSIPNFSSYSSVPDYVIVSHPLIWEGAVDFEQFKQSTNGGGDDAKLFNINELYNTYTYGDRNPLAIRRLIKDMIRIDTPSTLLLFGRGLTPNYVENGASFRKAGFGSSAFSKLDLVPTWGTPGSDILFTANLGEGEVPLVPVGRFPVDESNDVVAIKEKIESHLQLDPTAEWRKNVIHLSGGKTELEARVFANDVDGFKNVIEGEFFGGNVTTFTKKTDVPIEFFNISEQLNEGLSLITYIGHSSPDRIEIDLGNVSTDINGYRNKGKYPVLFLNGCNAGDMFRSFTTGEDWLMTPDRGALGVFSHASYGYSGPLARYTEVFYETAFEDGEFYGKTLGEIHQETIRRYRFLNTPNDIDHTQMTQWTFFGDPSMRFFAPEREELSIKSGSVILESALGNERLTAKSDSVKLTFTIKNQGKASGQDVKVCVSRVFNELKDRVNYDTLVFPIPPVESTHQVILFNELSESSGQNIFEVFVDCNDAFLEYDESNNLVSTSIDMPSNGVDLTHPYPYSILPSHQVNFVIESQDLAQKDASVYEVQVSNDFKYGDLLLDTTVLGGNFASFSKLFEGNSSNDTVTYYWRSKLRDSESDWVTSSFSVIENKTGWGQFQYGQFKENVLDNIIPNDETEQFRFDSVEVNLKFETSGKNQGDFIFNTNIIVNERTVLNHLDHVGGCTDPGVVVLPFRASDLSTYLVDAGVGYSVCGPDPKVVSHFNIANVTLRGNLKKYLDSIPVGDFIILMATGDTKASNIDVALAESLAQFGNTSMVNIPDGVPYVFVGEKGKSSVYYEMVILDDTQKISDSLRLSAISNFGQISTNTVGASHDFTAVSWSVAEDSLETLLTSLKQEGSGMDSTRFEVDAVIPDTTFDKESAFLNFSFDFTDSLNKSIPQPNYWAVCYESAPEGVVLSSILNEENQFEQGDSLKFSIPFVNITNTNFDGDLEATWELLNLSTGQVFNSQENLGLLQANDSVFLDLELSSANLSGRNKLTVQFNSGLILEQKYTNNGLSFFVDVNPDDVGPVTEVYIDDILASYEVVTNGSPIIKTVVLDGNEYLVKNDTVGVELFFAGPCEEGECEFTPIYFSDSRVSFTNENGSFVVTFSPEGLEDGRYLFNAKGADAFGNQDPDFFESAFIVKDAKELSYFLPYPSPFSSSMRFAYTLYGDRQPDKLQIQILGPDGGLVRAVSKEELGELKVGDRLTDWVWDGTDGNGKPLANGVYLYRVIIEDEEIKHLGTEADKYFKKGWGTIEISR